MRLRVVVGGLVVSVAAACAQPAQFDASRVVATPDPTATPEPTPEPVPTPPEPVAAPAARPRPARPPAPPPPPPSPSIDAFNGLGAWIDVFDFDDDPATILPAVRDSAAQGARTLYLESARFTTPTDIQYLRSTAAAIEEAHALGMKVVAWYPPGFGDLERDVKRSLAAIHWQTPKGHRFDAFAADVEYPDEVPDHAARSAAALEYSRRLREGAGPDYPLAAIVIPPTSHEINPNRWPGFPWSELAASYELFMPMNYWTGRTTDPAVVEEVTGRNVTETRRLTGKPVHVIGGLADRIDVAQAEAFVRAAKSTGSIGGGLYDHAITPPELWDILRGLN